MKIFSDNDKKFCVYALLDIRKPFLKIFEGSIIFENSENLINSEILFPFEPFYVGKGREHRPYEHFSEAKNLKNNKRLISKKINKIISETSSQPIVFYIKKDICEKEAFSLEHDVIKKIGKYNDVKPGPLVNNSEGGIGRESGWKHSEEAKSKMRGRIVSEQCRREHSLRMTGRKRGPQSEETKKKISESTKGKHSYKPYTSEQIENFSLKSKLKWQEKEYRENQFKIRKSFDNRRKISEGTKLGMNKLEVKEKISNGRKTVYKIYKKDKFVLELKGSDRLRKWCEQNFVDFLKFTTLHEFNEYNLKKKSAYNRVYTIFKEDFVFTQVTGSFELNQWILKKFSISKFLFFKSIEKNGNYLGYSVILNRRKNG
jgi:hypothetical protein